jgi:crossover junction endodeoxyribonuclease RuvC
VKILAFDVSLSCPGAAIVEVKNGKPKVIAVSHVKPDTKQSHAFRAEIVEAWAVTFIAENKGPFDIVTREDFHGQSSAQNYPVFSAWSGVERACGLFGLTFDKFTYTQKNGRKRTLLGVPQSKVKELVFGKGKAEKSELADAVRQITGYKGEFATYDESDAVAVALAYLINEGVIKREKK